MGVSRAQPIQPTNQTAHQPSELSNNSSGQCSAQECSAGLRSHLPSPVLLETDHYMPATAKLINTNGINFETSVLIFLLIVCVILLLVYCITAR